MLINERFKSIDFLTAIQPEEIGYNSSTVHCSSPSGTKYLKHLLNDLCITNNDSIIDIGSGKGSAMRIMLKFPFAKIDGIEISEYIADIAIKNFKKLGIKKCKVFNCDAVKFQRYSLYNMYYLYNPFPSEIMSKVLNNIYQSIQVTNREILLIYNNPVSHDLIINQGVFYKFKEYPNESGNKIYIYSNKSPRYSRLNHFLSYNELCKIDCFAPHLNPLLSEVEAPCTLSSRLARFLKEGEVRDEEDVVKKISIIHKW